MEALSGVKILILAGRRASARRWAGMLQGPDAQIWLASAEIPRDDRPDVVITDSPETDDRLLAAMEAGIVRIGPLPTDPAPAEGGKSTDVRLPGDATPRELRLACRLLAEIVRLRRGRRRGAELRRRLSQEALTDPLTGLPNRRAWDRALAERLAALAEPQGPDPARSVAGRLCLAIFDLDHFKRINDAHGHAAGDEVLRAAGRAICDGLREDDFVARLGGDEFGLLLCVPDEATAAAVVDRVRAALPNRMEATGAHPVAASAGYYLAHSPGPSDPEPFPDTLYAAADRALGEAKRQGRDRTVSGLR